MISEAKATLRIAEQSCTFWQPVSMHSLPAPEGEKNRLQIEIAFKQLKKNSAHLAGAFACG